jgi:hypothetical protein
MPFQNEVRVPLKRTNFAPHLRFQTLAAVKEWRSPRVQRGVEFLPLAEVQSINSVGITEPLLGPIVIVAAMTGDARQTSSRKKSHDPVSFPFLLLRGLLCNERIALWVFGFSWFDSNCGFPF